MTPSGFDMMYNPQVYVLHMGYPNYSSINENLSMSNCKNLKKLHVLHNLYEKYIEIFLVL